MLKLSYSQSSAVEQYMFFCGHYGKVLYTRILSYVIYSYSTYAHPLSLLVQVHQSVMAHYGLSSQEAQQRLNGQLQFLATSLRKVDLLRELRKPPYNVIFFLAVALSGLLLVLAYSLDRAERDGRVLFQGCALFLLALLNTALFCWEVTIIKTRRIRRLLSKVGPYLELPCPWTSSSYPTNAVTTLRGPCTVHALRDGAVVNLPASLVVQGDVIELCSIDPSPAKAILLDAEGMATNTYLEVGELPPKECFERPNTEEKISFVPDEEYLKFAVTQTPVIATLMKSIPKKRPTSILTREKTGILLGMYIVLLITLGISLVFNLIRFLALPDDSGPWTEMLLQLQVYTVLPLLCLPLPFLWVTASLHGTARIVLLSEECPQNVMNGRNLKNELKCLLKTIKQMVILALYPSTYPNYRLFHILGSLTSLCSVDKEHVLTDSAPIPEKVFFMSTGKSPENDQLPTNGKDIRRGMMEVRTEMEEVYDREKGGEERRVGYTDWKEEMEDDSMEVVNQIETASTTLEVESETTEICSGEDSTIPSTTKVPSDLVLVDNPPCRQISHGLSNSTPSLAAPFELGSEILDLSPDYSTPSGLCFDDINWEEHLGSLKPIGVNALAASHLLQDPYAWCPSGCTDCVRSNLNKTNCICPLGIEIGVTEYSQTNFTNEVLLFSISDPPQDANKFLSPRRASTSLLAEHEIQPHLVSCILHNSVNNSYLMMSRGSGEIVAACCSDFWDGKDLHPMTDFERDEIIAFYARRHLTSYCVALAYNPLSDIDMSPLHNQRIGLYIPNRYLRNHHEECTLFTVDEHPVTSYTGEQVYNNLLCNQVFLGIVSLQFRPKQDIVSLIEDMEVAGIRFVYFTNENEVRGKVFAEKLGLEAGWNCHISLAPSSEDEKTTQPPLEDRQFATCSSSTSSSLSSVINAFQSYIRAKLPKGIHQVRPHLRNVDNVPLLVPLFTDCTTDAVREMIKIMQENGEVVMCIGNSWGPDNLGVFAQANVSLSIIPESTCLHSCPKAKDNILSASPSDADFGGLPNKGPSCHSIWPTPLEMASNLNSAMCQLSCPRDSNLNIVALVTESRHIVSSIRHSLLFGLASSLSISILMLGATVLFLPPPLSGSHVFWILLFTIPAIALSLIPSIYDPSVRSQMPSRKKKVLIEKWLLISHFCFTFLPTSCISLLLFSLMLSNICSSNSTSGGDTDCHALLGNRNDSSSWNGWRGDSEQGLWLAQDVTAFFFITYLIANSIRFIHRTQPLWKLYKYVSVPYLAAVCTILILQIVYFAISQTLGSTLYNLPVSSDLSSVPFYVWVIGLLWLLILPWMHEILKYYDKKMIVKHQRHLKLEFETKLGMNSPF